MVPGESPGGARDVRDRVFDAPDVRAHAKKPPWSREVFLFPRWRCLPRGMPRSGLAEGGGAAVRVGLLFQLQTRPLGSLLGGKLPADGTTLLGKGGALGFFRVPC